MRSVTRHKYNARKTVVDGITFDSAKEAKRYKELKLMEKAKQIKELSVQPVFKYYVNNKLMFRYRADFYYCNGWTKDQHILHVYEDVKGYKTPIYRLKKKIIEAHFGIKITEI